ncbi:uncharacterized protein LOC120290166 [Eucalyptus grandis]|uniref:uncharacterized protein LOC120290166 n=1 Tax=Eucalyptus grandis TaxID=71139 RepID=UPI00192E812B|nr:uncharacterized protein LOC120290166 [Eucalyptus grandis]
MGHQVQNQAAAATAVANATAATATAPAKVQPGNVIRERSMHKLVEQFLKLNPLRFTGAGDPEAVTLWIRELEKVFALLRCSNKDKVVLVVYQLQGNAIFNGKYFSNCAREQRMAEFQRLRQGLLSVDQCEAKLAKPSKYAPRLIEDIIDRVRRFRDGLRSEIKDLLVPLNLKDYNDLYERAQLIERNLNERATASGSQFGSSKDGNQFGKKPMLGGSLPLEREIEFVIELASGMEPIFKAPYHMALSKLKELKMRIKMLQLTDPEMQKILHEDVEKRKADFQVSEDETLKFRGRLCVPDDAELKEEILSKAHCSSYSIHPGSTKMYQNLRQRYWWIGMKVDTAKCLTCH